MKVLKKITTLVLVIAMAFSVNVTGTFTESVKAATEFQIISPTNESIVGAGHVYIDWNNPTSGTVSKYNIYIDGNYVTSTNTNRYDYYTTSVKYHTTWIEAVLSNGSKEYTKTVKFGVSKKGLAVNDNMGRRLDPVAMNMGWYYTWGTTPFSYTTYNQIEFVPMIWGTGSESQLDAIAKKNYKYLLGYNEPDMKGDVGGSNINVNVAASHWAKLTGKSDYLGAPAPALCPAWDSGTWFRTFMDSDLVDKSTIDFIPLHCYYGTYGGAAGANTFLKEVVDATYNMYHKPIWITEFAVSGWGYSNASNRKQVEAFLKTAIEGLNKRSYVERYSWFSFDTTDNRNGASAVWTNSTGKLTDLGNIYVNNGNPTELATQGSAVNKYQPSSDNGSNNSSNNNTNNQPQVKKPARAKISKLKNVKRRKVKVSIKKIRKVKGFQIKYSDNNKFNGYWQKNSKKNTYTVKKLDKKTKYYFKVRAYVINGNKKLYGSYSKVKSITVKK